MHRILMAVHDQQALRLSLPFLQPMVSLHSRQAVEVDVLNDAPRPHVSSPSARVVAEIVYFLFASLMLVAML